MPDQSQHAYRTVFGSLAHYRKGNIEIVNGEARHYVFSNVFEVASQAAPYEKVVVGKNLDYVIEAVRLEGQSAWFACAHDEFIVVMDGEAVIDFVKLDAPVTRGSGTVHAGAQPAGRPMGQVRLRRGHQALLPAGAAYRINAARPGAAIVQTKLGVLSVQKWADICLQ